MCFVCSDIARHVLLEKSMGIMPVCVSGDFFFGEACELLYTVRACVSNTIRRVMMTSDEE